MNKKMKIHSKVKRLLKLPFIEQKSTEWYNFKKKVVSSSQAATILDCNPYNNKRNLLISKCNNDEHSNKVYNNIATEWGIKYEPIAVDIYEKMFKKKVFTFGLIKDPHNKWLAASPDGITSDGILLEIKSPYSRKLKEYPPKYYWIQCQILLQVCNLEKCHLFECEFKESKNQTDFIENEYFGHTVDTNHITYWTLENYKLHIIPRDREWFHHHKNRLHQFWKDMIYFQNNGIHLLNKRNRNSIDNINHRIKRRCTRSTILSKKYIDWSKWSSLSDINNFIRNEPLLDYLNTYGTYLLDNNRKIQKNNFQILLTFQKNNFKKKIIDTISQLPNINKDDIVKIATYDEIYSYNKVKDTKKHIKLGTPIIFNGVFHNHNNNTYGILDILVKNSYVDKIFPNLQLPIDIMNDVISNKYCLIMIKYVTLQLSSDGNYLLNNVSNKIIKSQSFLCNNALSHIQNYQNNISLVIGKKKKYRSKKESYVITNLFDNPGIIYYENNPLDMDITYKTQLALDWNKQLRSYNGNELQSQIQSIELQPNMKNNNDFPWSKVKKQLAEKNNEITLLWNVGMKEKNKLYEQNIFSWSDPRCNSKNMGLNQLSTKGIIIDKIISINKNNDTIIEPEIITNNLNEWKENRTLEFFIDFETSDSYLENNLDNNTNGHFIYMIGCGWSLNGIWNHITLVSKRLEPQYEYEIIMQLFDIMNNLKKSTGNTKINVYHWSHAEINFLKNGFKRHNITDNSIFKDFQWTDLMKVFMQEPIVIKGAFNFKLKEIASALYKHNLIQSIWDENNSCNSGVNALVDGLLCHKEAVKKNKSMIQIPLMKNIITYNELDCKILWEILVYLRTKHF